MNAIASRRFSLVQLDICLVLCGCLTFFDLRECGARVVDQDTSGRKVEEVYENLAKSSVFEPSRINDGLQSDAEVDFVTKEKRLRRIIEALGKFNKGDDAAKVESSMLNRDTGIEQNVQDDQSLEINFESPEDKQITSKDDREFKKLIKRPITRLKRADSDENDEKTLIAKISSSLAENKDVAATDFLVQKQQKIAVEGIRRLDIDVEEDDKKGHQEPDKVNTRIVLSTTNEKLIEIKPVVAEGSNKEVENKISEARKYIEQNKSISIDGTRKLDADIKQNDESRYQLPSNDNLRTAISGIIDKSAEINPKIINSIQSINTNNNEDVALEEIPSKWKAINQNSEIPQKTTLTENLFIRNIEQSNSNANIGILYKIKSDPKKVNAVEQDIEATSSHSQTSQLQFLKAQALEMQVKIRNNTFLHYLKEQKSEILPDILKFTENQFFNILKAILSKKNNYESNNHIYPFKNSELSDKQIEIIRYAQQLVEKKERQSFYDNITECIRALNVLNCMRIFIYPLIVGNMPEALIQGLPSFPINVTAADLLSGNRDKPKSARQVPTFNFYSNPVNPDGMIFNILVEGLLKNPPNENLPSYIEAKNEILSKYLTCNRLNLLQITEKFLPENARQGYSDEMLSCVSRFEYFSCIKYFSWPLIKQYYAELPQFPLSDSYLSSLIYPNYPLITFPGFESGFGHLPEVIESGPARIKLEAVFTQIFKKALNESARITAPPKPIHLDLIVKNSMITPEQMVTIHLTEQLLPANIRAEYVSKIVHCIKQFDFYNCMKFATWPIVKQFNPTVTTFPTFQEFINNLQIADIPQISSFFNYFSQFQFPQFQIPQFQIPDTSTFVIPDFSTFFPFAPQPAVPPAPVEPSSELVPESSNKNNTILELKIYKILKNIRDSLGATPLSAPTYTNRKVFLFPLMTEEQSKIFAQAEAILPPIAREPLITSIYFCLNERNEFSTCTKTIIWPFIRSYVKGLPEFPTNDDAFLVQQKAGINIPLTGSGDNFFIMREIEKLFFEGREDAMNYIIRLLQLSKLDSLNMQKVLEILRNIQFNTPEFLNMQTIKYSRLPEFTTSLTECQENIVHAVESIIPEQLRQKFIYDMLECAKKNKFAICSRNIIFPSIYQYFQKALSVPYYKVSPEKKEPKFNIAETNNIHPVRIETKINTEKQGENIVTTTDRKFMPIFPSNPELVIFSMLRKVQISAVPLPESPKESIANTPEFKQAFSIRQAHILRVAEAVLPEEFRKGILEKMYKCNEKKSFINCTRDIVFPALFKAYPDFPDFPNFDQDLNRSNMLSIIASLNNPTSSSRSYKTKRTLPFIEILYKFVSDDRVDILRTLIDRLPDPLYYDLYIKMAQCTQFSDVISCGHDIVYPTLKEYYDAPGFNLDKYYPITVQAPIYSSNQRSPFDYEIICENMGFVCTIKPLGSYYDESILNLSHANYETYIPFGKLSDGSRIFKNSQDIWNSNITPSVEADKTYIYRLAHQSIINIENLKKQNSHFFKIQGEKSNTLNFIKSNNNFLKRFKRNVDDLLDSYSDSIPDNKKNSVPRRIPPTSTFPYMTETQLYQILIDISNLKNERNSINENFILNDTEKDTITPDQYKILKLVHRLNSETAKAGFMSRLVQCIRSLSFLQCIGIFVWPMISNNIPAIPFFPATRDSRVSVEETQFEEVFRISSYEFENELINRKEQIETNCIQWYKALTEEKFETQVGSLKVKSDGNGELAITVSNLREGRMLKIKDNKNLPSILTIISEVIEEVFDSKLNKTKHKKENLKRNKRKSSFFDFENSILEIHSKHFNKKDNFIRLAKDEQTINILLEKVRPTVTNIKNECVQHYFNLEDWYKAFEILFGPKIIEKVVNRFESLENYDDKNFDGLEESKRNDKIKLLKLQVQKYNEIENVNIPLSKSRAISDFEIANKGSTNSGKQLIPSDKLSRLKLYFMDFVKKYLNHRKMPSELSILLPKLKDNILGQKITDLSKISRGLKSKINQMMPAAGLAVSFVVQLVMAHAKAAASVAGLISNMALASAVFGLIRDTIFGTHNDPQIKYVYDTEKYNAGIIWPHLGSGSPLNYISTNRIHDPSSYFDKPY